MGKEIIIPLQDCMNLIKKPSGKGKKKIQACRYKFEENYGVPVSMVIQKIHAGDFQIYRRGSK